MTLYALIKRNTKVYFKDKAQPQGPRPGRADEARGMRRMRELRDDVPRLRDYCREVG